MAVVALHGEHDAQSAPKLELDLALLQFDRYSIVVDLSETELIDSTIVSVLLRARDTAHQGGLKFALVVDEHTGAAVHAIFDHTHLLDVFATGKTPRAALDAA